MKLQKLAFSLFFLTCFLAKLSVSLYHSLEEDHSAELCAYNDVEHLCNHDSENHKDYLELNLNYNSDYEYQFTNKLQINSVDILKSNFLTNHQQLPFSLRGPPSFNFI
jgi:hypothetical protein